MPALERLRAGHAPAVLAFERANRGYFARFISDRGDEFFDRFAEGFAALLADQDAGSGAFYVLADDGGAVLGRFNLYAIADGGAELGYRMAERAAGRGLATATVRSLCTLAATDLGLCTIRAAVSDANVPSRRVLLKAGFTPDGPADPAHLGNKPGTWYRLDLPTD